MPVNLRLRIVLQVSVLILLTTPLAPWARTTEDEQQQASDEAAKQKELDGIVEKIAALNIDDPDPSVAFDRAKKTMETADETAAILQRIESLDPLPDKAQAEEQRIADILQQIKDSDPLAGGSQEACLHETTEDGVGEEGNNGNEKQGKEATEANDGSEKGDGATDPKDKETPEGSAERRAKLYAEITDRLTRIVEKLTAIVDFLNKTLGAIAQQGAVQQPVPQPTDDKKAKAAEEEAAKAAAEAAEKEAAQKAAAEKAAAEKAAAEAKATAEKAEAAKAAAEKEHKSAGSAKAGQAAGEEKAPEEKTSPQETGEIAPTQGKGHTGHAQHEGGNTQDKMTGGEAVRKTAGTSPDTEAANNAEWQILLARVEIMSDKVQKFSESAKQIEDATKKQEIETKLNEIKGLLEIIHKADAGKLSADDILILKEMLDEADEEISSIEEYFKAVEKPEEDPKKKV